MDTFYETAVVSANFCLFVDVGQKPVVCRCQISEGVGPYSTGAATVPAAAAAAAVFSSSSIIVLVCSQTVPVPSRFPD